MPTHFLSHIRKRFSAPGHRFLSLALSMLLIGGLAACDSGEDLAGLEGTAGVRILLTDAPTDMLEIAEVFISRVYLQGGGDDDADDTGGDDADGSGGRVDLFNDPDNPLVLDLLQLQNGVTADLTGVVEVDASVYQGLRLVVDSTRLVLAEGYTFEDGSTEGTFFVPSGSQSGIKVQTQDILDFDADQITTLTVDFPVDENFVIQMAPQSDNVVRRVLFTPVLREIDRESEDDDG